MEKYRLEGRTIFFCNETAFETKSQPKKMLADLTVLSVKDAEEKGLKWNCNRGIQILLPHIIGEDGFLKDMK